jgi:surfeit locus 1 family protein
MVTTTPRLKGLRFRPRKWAFALALTASVVMISLGNWQARRAQEKRDLAARVERAGLELPMAVPGGALPPETLALRRLLAKGEFLPQFTVLLDNKVYRGRPGYYVVTPLRVAGTSMHVLVNRGWIAAGQRREDLPEVATPAGEVLVEGLGQARAPRVLAAGEIPPAGKVWQNLTFEHYAKWSGLALQPVFLEQHSSLPDGLVRDWPRADFGVDKHTGYATQWYLFATVAILIFIVLSFERVRPASR